jgi:YD repeat-containing protein
MTRGSVTETRTFVYNGSDLTSATNPENGTVTYVYDNSHHVTSRTDALGSKTVYTYDSYGRLSEVQYYPRGNNNEDTTQRVTYYYDGKFPAGIPVLSSHSAVQPVLDGKAERGSLRRRHHRRISRFLLLSICLQPAWPGGHAADDGSRAEHVLQQRQFHGQLSVG